uniref:EF-hand domain-containing protein n=1 Tax=Elaeophora elaphi TaxID=1147741 RepID=A0A0R3RQ49_9BILA
MLLHGKTESDLQDLMESLALLCLPTPEANAIWTIRMIKGSDVETITEADLVAFVKSVFRLALLEKSKGKTSNCAFHMIDNVLHNVAIHRSHGTFKVLLLLRLKDKNTVKTIISIITQLKPSELDKAGNGYICKSDFVNFFQQNGCLDPIFKQSFMCLKIR